MNRRLALPIVLVVILSLACGLGTPAQVQETAATPAPATAEPTAAPADTPTSPTDTPPPPGQALAPGEGAAGCAGPQPPLVADFDVRQTPNLPEPAARTPFRDPVFGTCLVRVTDRKADLPPDDTSAGLKNEYSRVQSFNADGSRIMVRGIDGTWYVYDAQTFQATGPLPINTDPRWDTHDPNRLYFAEDTRLMAYQIGSEEPTTVHDFAQDLPNQSLAAVWTRYEGSPSRDGRTWGLMAQNQDWLAVTLLVYDQQADRVTAKRDLPAPLDVDSVTISPLGTYLLAFFSTACEPDQPADDAHPCGLMVYDRDLKNGRNLLRAVGHADAALDVGGREVLVYQDVDTDHISMLDLASGAVTQLLPIDFSHTAIGLHFSGRAFDRPGWVLVSTYNGGHPTDYTWMDDSVFAVELKAGGRVVRLAHTHSLVDESQEHDYWAEPHASVNPDFTRVLFTSNWGRSGTGEVEMFMITLPPDWSGAVPAVAAAPTPFPPTETPESAVEPAQVETASAQPPLGTPAATPTAAPPAAQGSPLNPNPPASPVRLIFIHHSSGENWLSDGNGNLGLTLDKNNYFVSDTNYGWGPDAIGDRTDIVNWPEWFRGENSERYLAALYAENGQNSGYTRSLADPGGENEIVMFKSCFPNSSLEGNPDDPPAPGDSLTVGNAKYIYNDLLKYFATRPDKLFVVITAPPNSETDYGANARAFNTWLVRDWLAENGYAGRNVAVFDFYNILTGPDNHHRYRDGAIEYVTNGGSNNTAYPTEDDHPSSAGNQKATAEFVPWLNVTFHCWRGEGGCP
jgi:hypothetical protein